MNSLNNLLFQLLALISALLLAGCYTEENASDVNQDRIKANYTTTFNLTHRTTEAQIQFLFGQTPLRMTNPSFFHEIRLREEKHLLLGLHYQRLLSGLVEETYRWQDENSKIYEHMVEKYEWDLSQPISVLKKNTYYKLPWSGEKVPGDQFDFTIHLESRTENRYYSFSSTELLEIEPDKLDEFPLGKAILRISRSYSIPVLEKTDAGARSTVCVEREWQITISE